MGIESFGDLVSAYHGGKYARELAGDGTLALTTDPEGAEVWLSPQVERGPVLVEGEPRRLGATPLMATPLAMGSYVVVLKKEGYRDTRYPLHISRNREWVESVRLATEEEIGRGFVYVPGGLCGLGGDEDAFNAWPRKEVQLEDFFIAEHPVTVAEYLDYVNDLASPDYS